MNPNITIRPESRGDSQAIREVHERAFPTSAEAQLVDRLRHNGELIISLVAILDSNVVGHVALSPIWIDQEMIGLGLAPVAVLPAQHRKGIGGALIRHAFDQCRHLGIPVVVVLGDPKYYARFGFVSASEYGLTCVYHAGDAFQAILIAANEPPKRGLVHYALAFAALK